MKHFGKKLISVVLALMCLATIGVVSASATVVRNPNAQTQSYFTNHGQRYLYREHKNGNWSYAPVDSKGRGNGTYYLVDEQHARPDGYTPVYRHTKDSSGHDHVKYVGLKNERA